MSRLLRFDMRRRPFRNLGFVALLILAFSLPFELESPWLRLGPLSFTNVEIILAVVLSLAALAGPAAGGPTVPRLWLALAVWFVIGLILATALAPEFRLNAIKATFRTIQGLLLVPALLWLAPTSRHGRFVVLALVGGGLLAALIGLAEHWAGDVFPWLSAFRPEATFAGPFQRLSGPFDYANQAAMYIEATLPFLFALVISAFHSRRWLPGGIGVIALVLYGQAAILTFSRASFITLFIAAGIVALVLILSRGYPRQLGLAWGVLAAGVIVLIGFNWLFTPYFRLRLQSNVDTEWYRSEISAPAELIFEADATQMIPVTVKNQGKLSWQPEGKKPFLLGLRWQTKDGQSELVEHQLWPLTEVVQPGEALTLQVEVRPPIVAGSYNLLWDILQEDVNWFDARGDDQTFTQAVVNGDMDNINQAEGGHLAASVTTPLQFDAPLPGRRELWTIAAHLIRAHPLTGIGIDNYRLTYSRHLADDPLPGTALDQTIHSNNWFLETLVSVGLFGALPFFIWLGLIMLNIIRALRLPISPLTVAAGSSLIAFVVHGLLDYFLLHNATALIFWMIVSLWVVFNHDNPRI